MPGVINMERRTMTFAATSHIPILLTRRRVIDSYQIELRCYLYYASDILELAIGGSTIRGRAQRHLISWHA